MQGKKNFRLGSSNLDAIRICINFRLGSSNQIPLDVIRSCINHLEFDGSVPGCVDRCFVTVYGEDAYPVVRLWLPYHFQHYQTP